MRTFPTILALALLILTNLTAGRLDIAVIQFPGEKTPEGLATAFAGVNLSEITNANRTITKEPCLQGGYVLYAQCMTATPGTTVRSATRIKDSRADIEGRLGSGSLSVAISLMEGVKAGLRSFEKKNYAGSGPLPAGVPRVLSIKQIHRKSSSVVKGQAGIEHSNLTTVVVAQYTP
ncbi:MAG: hypothetical protein WCQ57_13945 [Verrucomicrobiota bacterium]